MRALPHAVIGACAGVVLANAVPHAAEINAQTLGQSIHLTTPVVLAAAAAFGALLPDLDRPGATATKLPIIGGLMAEWVAALVYGVSLVRPVRNPFPRWRDERGQLIGDYLFHRGPFHAPIMAPLIYVAFGTVPAAFCWALSISLSLIDHLAGTQGLPHAGLLFLSDTFWSWAQTVFMPPAVLLAIVVGFLSHLAADEPTKLGLPLLWPFVTDTIRLPKWLCWRSGSARIEWLIAGVAAALVLYAYTPMFHVAT